MASAWLRRYGMRARRPQTATTPLIRFTLTNGWNPLRMPTFNFRCDDQLLQLVALRSYLPFASDTAWTYVRFD